jgi:histidinol phosphatase-like enzyme
VRTDDCRIRPGAEPQPAPCAYVLPDRDRTITVDHGYAGSADQIELIPGSDIGTVEARQRAQLEWNRGASR